MIRRPPRSTRTDTLFPYTTLFRSLDVWAPYYIERVQAVLDGTWKTSDVWHGLKEGMVVMAPYNPKLPPEAVEAAETVRKEIGRAHSELQSLVRISYAVFCLKKKKQRYKNKSYNNTIILTLTE